MERHAPLTTLYLVVKLESKGVGVVGLCASELKLTYCPR